MAYDINIHGDFRRYYDTTQKRNYWVLGYFGGGSINVSEANRLSVEMAAAIGVPQNTIRLDEVPHSRRYKGFKFIYSMEPNQLPEKDAEQMENVYAWLTD